MWNKAVTKWFEHFQKRSEAAGQVSPRATVEASPDSGNHRLDVIVPCIRSKFIFVIDLAYYFGPSLEAGFFKRDAVDSSLPFLKACSARSEIFSNMKLGRKLEQAYYYMSLIRSNPNIVGKYNTYCCLATVVGKWPNNNMPVEQFHWLEFSGGINPMHTSRHP
uniref:Uncharacterized protein n=1 Tax=Ditylenchus dipsaci TaxID=166011 RepID=A0A915CUA2_9BILA